MKKALVVMMVIGVVFALWGASLAGDEPEVKLIKGEAACLKCCFKVEKAECAPAVKVGEDVLLLKASDKADKTTIQLIASFKGAAKCTKVVIKGVVKDKAVVADAVKKVEEKKAE